MIVVAIRRAVVVKEHAVVARRAAAARKRRPEGDVQARKGDAGEIEPVPALAPVLRESDGGDFQERLAREDDEEENLRRVTCFDDPKMFVPRSRRRDRGGSEQCREDDRLELFVGHDAVGKPPGSVGRERHLFAPAHAKHRPAHLPPLSLRLRQVQRARLAQRADPGELVEDHPHVQVEQAERAQHDERQEKRERCRVRVPPRLFVDADGIEAVEEELPVPVQRGRDEERHQRVGKAVEVQVGVRPRPSMRQPGDWMYVRPDARVARSDARVVAAEKLPREDLHAEYAKHGENQQQHRGDVDHGAHAQRDRFQHEAHAGRLRERA